MLSVVLGMLGKDQQVVRCRGFGGGAYKERVRLDTRVWELHTTFRL